ncbi:hypothetical protein [Enterovirga sp. CN4-39]|uniref:hypothetical protein n=1 Tax=Enterovirga sp. CN4-39 TaxID=3400910 RepID=UPI003C11C064
MPTFEISDGSGRYQVTAPDENAAFEAFRSMSSAAPPAPEKPSVAADIAGGVQGGVIRGAAGMAGLPGFAVGLLQQGADEVSRQTVGRVYNRFAPGGTGAWDQDARPRQEHWTDQLSPTSVLPQPQGATRAVEGVIGETYRPQTIAGKYAASVGEMAGGGLRAVPSLAAGLLSEGAGQATEGTALEPWARAGGAIVGGLGAAALSRPTTGAQAVADFTERMAPAQVDAIEALMWDAAAQGVPLTRAEAAQAVTGGSTRLGDLQRLVEGRGELREFMAQRPAQVEGAARRAFDDVAPPITSPTQLGRELQDGGQAAVARTPEAQALEQARWAAGPRVTPEEAGRVIQPELRQVYERREGMRAALGDQDYTAARNAPAEIPLDGGFGFRDVTKHYDRPGPGIFLDPVEREAATQQWMAANNVTERMPVIGLAPTRFGQADVTTVLEHLDEVLGTAKGSVRQGLEAARKALFTNTGELDTTIAGLHGSRTAITDLIDQAKRAGANGAVRELEGALGTLDQALERVPAYGQARRHFEAASRPLAPFGDTKAPGRIVERDQYGKEFVLPVERVPAAIDQGSSAARDFSSVASDPARRAYEGHLTTRVLDAATDGGGNVSADALRSLMRDNEDILRQFPDVRDRLGAVAIARDGLARVEQTFIGRLASRPDVRAAMDALFPANPVPGSAGEVLDAVSALAKSQPTAARQLVRAHAESTFNHAARSLTAGDNQFGGAKFVSQLKGNRQQAENLAAAIRGLPGGDAILPGFDRFLEIMAATGQRQRPGSLTAYNIEALNELKGGGAVGTSLTMAAGAGTQLPRKVLERFQQWNLGQNTAEIARILTDPAAAPLFRHLATAQPGAARTNALLGRLVSMAGTSAAAAERSRQPVP